MAAALSALDLIALGGRLVSYVRTVRAGEEKFAFKSCWNTVVLDREDHSHRVGAEYAGLVSEDPEELDAAELKAREIEGDDVVEPIHVRRAQFVEPIDTALSPRASSDNVDQWANDRSTRPPYPRSAGSERTVFEHSRQGSVHSDETLHVETTHFGVNTTNKVALMKKIGRGVFATAERCLVFAGYLQTISGIVVYTGGCRGGFINVCLAHLISK